MEMEKENTDQKVVMTLAMVEVMVSHLRTFNRSTNAFSGGNKDSLTVDVAYYKTQVRRNTMIGILFHLFVLFLLNNIHFFSFIDSLPSMIARGC